MPAPARRRILGAALEGFARRLRRHVDGRDRRPRRDHTRRSLRPLRLQAGPVPRAAGGAQQRLPGHVGHGSPARATRASACARRSTPSSPSPQERRELAAAVRRHRPGDPSDAAAAATPRSGRRRGRAARRRRRRPASTRRPLEAMVEMLIAALCGAVEWREPGPGVARGARRGGDGAAVDGPGEPALERGGHCLLGHRAGAQHRVVTPVLVLAKVDHRRRGAGQPPASSARSTPAATDGSTSASRRTSGRPSGLRWTAGPASGRRRAGRVPLEPRDPQSQPLGQRAAGERVAAGGVRQEERDRRREEPPDRPGSGPSSGSAARASSRSKNITAAGSAGTALSRRAAVRLPSNRARWRARRRCRGEQRHPADRDAAAEGLDLLRGHGTAGGHPVVTSEVLQGPAPAAARARLRPDRRRARARAGTRAAPPPRAPG